jgi:hypothetical protein
MRQELDRKAEMKNPDYDKYLSLLLKLKAMRREGRGDTEEADQLREQMDEPWDSLSVEEQKQLALLSASLDMLEGKEVFRDVPAEQRTREWMAPRWQTASETGDLETQLELLRNGPDFLTANEVAFLRGKVYLDAGHPEAALLFFAYAAQVNPAYFDDTALFASSATLPASRGAAV